QLNLRGLRQEEMKVKRGASALGDKELQTIEDRNTRYLRNAEEIEAIKELNAKKQRQDILLEQDRKTIREKQKRDEMINNLGPKSNQKDSNVPLGLPQPSVPPSNE